MGCGKGMPENADGEMQHTHHLLLWARRLAGDRLPSGGGIRYHPKMDRKRVRLKSCTLHTMGENTPVCSVFHGKGRNYPFPHTLHNTAGVTRLRDRALMRQRTCFPSSRGAHGNADAAHRPQDKRFTFGKRQARTGGSAARTPSLRARAGTSTGTHWQGFASPARHSARSHQ